MLLVMLYHFGAPVRGGHLGVNAFFVLSGFLITSLILREAVSTGWIALGRFYLRRVLRLYPPLLALIAFVTAWVLLVPSAYGRQTLDGTPAVLFYFSNWVRGLSGAEMPLGLYEHTWSLSVEEQFYIAWPLILWGVLALTRRLWAVGAVAVLGCAASMAARFVVAPGVLGSRLYSGTDTQADQLLFGCALAVLVLIAQEDAVLRDRLARAFRFAVWPAIAFVGVAAFVWVPGAASPVIFLMMAVVALCCSVIIGHLYLSPGTRLASILASKPAVYIGRRSYALYLWHLPIYLMLGESSFAGIHWIRVPLEAALSFAAAELSWRLVERPALALKRRVAADPVQS